MKLTRTSRILSTVGIKTSAYKNFVAYEEDKAFKSAREQAYLTYKKEEALSEYPELKEVYAVEENALAFYQKVLSATPTTLDTNHRNIERAKSTGLEAIYYLNKGKEIPKFSTEGRAHEAEIIKVEELNHLRARLNITFDENSKTSSKLMHDARKNYAKYALAFFANENSAIVTFPELAPLVKLKKQARRYYPEWVEAGHIEGCVKDCINRAIKDISKGFPIQTALEIKDHAKSLGNSFIGLSRGEPQKQSKKEKKRVYQYNSANLMKQLLGKNGLRTGRWPYSFKTQEEVRRITFLDEELKLDQMKAAFSGLDKETALEKFKELAPLYAKREAALNYFGQKVTPEIATIASELLIEGDFKKLIKGEALEAVSELTPELIAKTIKKATTKHLYSIESAPQNALEQETIQGMARIQASVNTEFLEASNDVSAHKIGLTSAHMVLINELETPIEALLHEFYEQVDKGEYKREDLALYLEEIFACNVVSEEEQEKLIDYLKKEGLLVDTGKETQKEESGPQTVHKQASQGISLSTLNSTAPKLDMTKMFHSSHKAHKVKQTLKGHRWDIKRIEQGLNDNIENVCKEVLGDYKSKQGNQLRFGSKNGSLIVTISGNDKGKWYDHQEGKGGKLLNLIMQEKSLSFKEALDYAGDYLGLTPEPFEKEVVDVSDLKGIDEDKLKLVAYARELADKSMPIQGTLAETYLKNRGIDTEQVSSSVRFVNGAREKETDEYHPALLLVGNDIEGTVQGAQVIFLDKEGHKLQCETPKRSYGLIKGSTIPVQEGGNILAVAEGPETALSIANANPNMTVLASLGSITNVSSIDFNAKGNTVVVCQDNDINNHESNQKAQAACAEFAQKGFNVLTVKPSTPGEDFNDVLQQQGIDALRAELNQLEFYAKACDQKTNQQQRQQKEIQRVKKYEDDLEMEI